MNLPRYHSDSGFPLHSNPVTGIPAEAYLISAPEFIDQFKAFQVISHRPITLCTGRKLLLFLIKTFDQYFIEAIIQNPSRRMETNMDTRLPLFFLIVKFFIVETALTAKAVFAQNKIKDVSNHRLCFIFDLSASLFQSSLNNNR